MPNQTYRNCVTFEHKLKGIPYGGSGEPRADGQANHGFKNIKGEPELLDAIPELASDPVLKDLVAAINGAETGVFSVGCLSAEVPGDGGIHHTGYVEFAVNSKSAVGNAQTYFGLWYHFEVGLHRTKFLGQIQLNWEIQPAAFRDASDTYGFSCAIWFQTANAPDKETALRNYALSLAALSEFFRHPFRYPDPIY